MNNRFRDASAFRRSLETRLRQDARQTGVPLDRLRKEIAHQRLLARLVRVAPEGSWVLKGGQVLLARLGAGARATKDADATWRASTAAFGDILGTAIELEHGDFFAFEIGTPRSLEAETTEGGLRFPVLALVDGREFERLQLDVNFVPGDIRPLEHLRMRNLLAFADIEPPLVPVIPVAQHLAEKLHAYVRRYAEDSSRPRDLFDMLIIAQYLPIPAAGRLTEVCRQTFQLRQTPWPPELPLPPDDWERAWSGYIEDYGIPWNNLAQAYGALADFWRTIFEATTNPDRRWESGKWSWE